MTTRSWRELAARHGVELRDLRRPPDGLNVPTGANLELPARIVLTVGSDCAIGKMTVSLELDRAARARGLASRFVPTGQTGIAIAGWGIAVDAVVSDFLAGAAERLVVEGHERGGELLFVEGQGAVIHPAYSGVTLGLIHGSAPHALRPLPPGGRDRGGGLSRASDAAAAGARRAARTDLAARPQGPRGGDRAEHADLSTRMPRARRSPRAEAETGLSADDPVRFGADRLLDAVLASLD